MELIITLIKIFLDEEMPLKTLDFPRGDITEVDVFVEKWIFKTS